MLVIKSLKENYETKRVNNPNNFEFGYSKIEEKRTFSLLLPARGFH